MFIRICLILLACYPALSNAADLQLVQETKLGKLKIDKASLVKGDKLSSVIFVYEFNETQKAVPPNEAHDKREDKLIFDCAAKTFGLAKRVYYLGGKAIQTSLMQGDHIYFNPAPPDSLAEKMIKTVCDAEK